ncbi:MAG: TIM barrel protein [Puniceicoccaceae bacterium]
MKANILHSRRNFLGTTALATAGVALAPQAILSAAKPNSKFGGVQIGVITYSWRNMTTKADEIIDLCVKGGISSIELMGNVVEEWAGIPAAPPRIKKGTKLSQQQRKARQLAAKEAAAAQKAWRLSFDTNNYKQLRKKFDRAGVNIHIVKFNPGKWSDEEMDYAFKSAKALGAKGVCNEIGEDACKRMGKAAEKHNMYAIFHNHLQPGEPGFSFEKFLAYSPNNMLNLDIGHYYGATGKNPAKIVEKLHDRIFSIHLKDKTGKNDTPANTNMPWGEGTTPIGDVLNLIKDNKWPIYCDIELEYPVPSSSNPQNEIVKCVKYCKRLLA